MNNLINETAHQSVLAEMQARLRVWMARHEDNSAESQRLLTQMNEDST